MSSQECRPLTVQDVERQTEDAVTITFRVPEKASDYFRYQPGQYLMVRFTVADGEEEFRSYSICKAPPADGSAPASVRIAVKLLGPGGFGEFAHARLSPGDTVDVLPPTGRFRLRSAPRHLAIAAGSGITPVLAIAEAALTRGDEFALVYGNRTTADIMFATEVTDLQSRFADRFAVHHILSREHHEDPLRHGRIGADNLRRLLAAVGRSTDDPEVQYYVCGPEGLIDTVRSFLTAADVERRRIHSELFATSLASITSSNRP